MDHFKGTFELKSDPRMHGMYQGQVSSPPGPQSVHVDSRQHLAGRKAGNANQEGSVQRPVRVSMPAHRLPLTCFWRLPVPGSTHGC